MSRRRLAYVLLAVLISAAAVVAQVQQSTPQFRSSTHVVPVYATVTDSQGRLVPNLTRDDFQVFDNGSPQPITTFSAGRQPISVVVMLDRSGSVADRFPLIEAAAERFVEQLAPNDRARIGSFSERVEISPDGFTSDQDELKQIIRHGLQKIGPTPLWNATDAAMTALSAETGRRVVLIFTDGHDAPLDDPRNVTLESVRRRAQTEEVMIYGVGLLAECGSESAPPTPARFAAGWFDLAGQRGRQGRPPTGRGRVRLPPIPLPIPGRGLPPRTPPIFDPGKSSTSSGCSDERPDPELRALTEFGGGGYFELRKSADLSRTFARVVEELHNQYLLGFVAPSHDGVLHRVHVSTRRTGLTVRARTYYTAPGATAKSLN
jgi:VWFA-related protein